jgi:hypothetical protein
MAISATALDNSEGDLSALLGLGRNADGLLVNYLFNIFWLSSSFVVWYHLSFRDWLFVFG